MKKAKEELIERITSCSDTFDKKEILEQLIIEQKLDDSFLSYSTKGGIPQEQTKEWLKEKQKRLRK